MAVARSAPSALWVCGALGPSRSKKISLNATRRLRLSQFRLVLHRHSLHLFSFRRPTPRTRIRQCHMTILAPFSFQILAFREWHADLPLNGFGFQVQIAGEAAGYRYPAARSPSDISVPVHSEDRYHNILRVSRQIDKLDKFTESMHGYFGVSPLLVGKFWQLGIFWSERYLKIDEIDMFFPTIARAGQSRLVPRTIFDQRQILEEAGPGRALCPTDHPVNCSLRTRALSNGALPGRPIVRKQMRQAIPKCRFHLNLKRFLLRSRWNQSAR